jgi:hydrogenase maturation protein HypF
LNADTEAWQQLSLRCVGRVQGVGFRPAVCRIASGLGLAGRVFNDGADAVVEVAGRARHVHQLRDRLWRLPRPVQVLRILQQPVQGREFSGFHIEQSARARDADVVRIPLDIATCAQCLREMSDPGNRRFGHPFISCAECGPRYTICADLPFDRDRTSMSQFALCPRCQAEYRDPSDRRFHAQTIACPDCGPRLRYFTRAGDELTDQAQALVAAASALRNGQVLAVKGWGGFHLVARADCEPAVRSLRAFKHRPDKPFAVMFASVDAVREACEMDDSAQSALASAAAPIVILPLKGEGRSPVCPSVGRSLHSLGCMLPATPVYHLLIRQLGCALVVTSGNRGGEPLCTDDASAQAYLHAIADGFLTDDRPIRHPVDDSVVQGMGGSIRTLRLGRGLGPLVLDAADETCDGTAPAVIGLGGHEKLSCTVAAGGGFVMSPHLGDGSSSRLEQHYRAQRRGMLSLCGAQARLQVLDAHPDYLTRQFACPDMETLEIQHHHAHVLSVCAEHRLAGPVLAFACDGNGYGGDGTVWGGEVLLVDGLSLQRVGSLRPFMLPGGEKAMREPRRSALGLWHALDCEQQALCMDPVRAAFSETEFHNLLQLLQSGRYCVQTTSLGRLWDGFAALLGLCRRATYEEQAPTLLEECALSAVGSRDYRGVWRATGDRLVWDWQPVVAGAIDDLQRGIPRSSIARAVHDAWIDACVEICCRWPDRPVILAGGAFQNRILAAGIRDALRPRGVAVFMNETVPAGDGGLSLGQAYAGQLFMRGGGHVPCSTR